MVVYILSLVNYNYLKNLSVRIIYNIDNYAGYEIYHAKIKKIDT